MVTSTLRIHEISKQKKKNMAYLYTISGSKVYLSRVNYGVFCVVFGSVYSPSTPPGTALPSFHCWSPQLCPICHQRSIKAPRRATPGANGPSCNVVFVTFLRYYSCCFFLLSQISSLLFLPSLFSINCAWVSLSFLNLLINHCFHTFTSVLSSCF